MDTAAFPSDLARFVHDLVITGAWLDEVWVGITAEHLALTGGLAHPMPRSADGGTDG